jgi:hypothetical protein
MRSPTRLALFLAAAALAGCRAKAPDDPLAETVKAEVDKMMTATADGRYEVVIDMTHPKALEEMGGREKALEVIGVAMDQLKGKGVRFKVTEVGKPTVVKGDGGHYAVAPYTMEVTAPGKKATSRTAVVGVSVDGGKTWKFVNTDTKGEAEIRKILPDLPRDLKIPKQEVTTEDVR